VRRLLALAALAVCAVFLVAGCGSSGSSSSSTSTAPTTANTIVIKNFMFAPMALTVSPGATVTVKNEDSATHTVTASDKKSFDTGNVTSGTTKTFTAPSKPGSYTYICGIHQYMQGTLTVK
jgi:plastocyanin